LKSWRENAQLHDVNLSAIRRLGESRTDAVHGIDGQALRRSPTLGAEHWLRALTSPIPMPRSADQPGALEYQTRLPLAAKSAGCCRRSFSLRSGDLIGLV